MNVKDYLDKVAYITEMDIMDDGSLTKIYKSKFDDSYITHVGMENDIKFLADRDITGELTHGVGYSPKDEKWYGWSHRAIFGFSIGSICKKGDCHYIGSTLKEQEEAAILFWSDPGHLNVRCNGIVEEGSDKFFDIIWEYDDKIPNKKLRNTISGVRHHITPTGNGEWTAKTMKDAKQMAIDFNKGVS